MEKNSIRMVQKFTLPLLTTISKAIIAEDITKTDDEIRKLENELKSLNVIEKENFLKQRENILKNMQQTQRNVAFTKTLPKMFQNLVKLGNKLDADIKLNEKKKNE